MSDSSGIFFSSTQRSLDIVTIVMKCSIIHGKGNQPSVTSVRSHSELSIPSIKERYMHHRQPSNTVYTPTYLAAISIFEVQFFYEKCRKHLNFIVIIYNYKFIQMINITFLIQLSNTKIALRDFENLQKAHVKYWSCNES